jgi:[acyl-carrier-protein] S-malonyltransferase
VSDAWLFPGQGAQVVGMGRDLASVSSAARDVFRRADDALHEHLSAIIFDGSEETLRLTANAQPAILAVSVAVLATLHERLPSLPPAHFVAGHSLGEYSALVASHALEFEDAVRLVRARALAMQDAVPVGVGAMAAVIGIDGPALEAMCADSSQSEFVAPANYNAPSQIVVAGHTSAIGRLKEKVAAAGGRVLPLQVSAPFHCRLMAAATPTVREALARVTVHPPLFPFVSNFDALPTVDPEHIRVVLLRQIEAPVRWQQTVCNLVERGVDRFFEIGPGTVLTRLARRIAPGATTFSVNDDASLEAAIRFVLGSAPSR